MESKGKVDQPQQRQNDLVVVAIIVCLALAIRLWFLILLQGDPVFCIPISDPKEFNFWAFRMANGQWLWDQLPNHTPLYAYFLAGIYKLFGFHVNAPALVQCVLGALSAGLMYRFVLRIANALVAAGCALFMAVYWFFIYTQVYLFSENLSMFLNIALACYLTFAKDSFRKYFVSGGLLGLSLACRPDILPMCIIILWWIAGQVPDPRRYLKYYGVFLIGVATVLMPIIARNHQVSGDWVLRGQIGANIYMGNDPELVGSNIFVEKGRIWQYFISMPDREMNSERNLSEGEINRFYVQKTLTKIKERPGQWLKLMGSKIFTILTGREYLRSEDVYFRDRFIWGSLAALLTTRTIFLLALVGLVLSWPERRKYRLVYAFLLSALGAFLFPAKTRYLVPVIPFLMVFSALTISSLCQAVRDHDQVKLLRIAIAVMALSLLSWINPLGLREPDASETHYSTASNLQYQRNYPLAEEYFRLAVHLNPANASAWHDLGILYLSTEDYRGALECFDEARKTDPYYGSWDQYYYEQTRSAVEQGRTMDLPSSFTKLESEDDPDVRRYLEYFHFP